MKSVYLLMDEMELSERYLGYEYIACAVAILESKGGQVQMKVLYREVAEQFGTSPACVERDIRTAAGILMRSIKFRRSFGGRKLGNSDFLRKMVRLSGKITKKLHQN